MTQEPASYWTAVANIVHERPYGPGGAETRRGTKHFAPGAKVYIIDWYAGGCARIVVVGLHRSSKRMILLVIDVNLVENLRAKVCYVPAVIAKIKEHYAPNRLPWLTQEFAENICTTIPFWRQARRHQPMPLAETPATTLQPILQAAHHYPGPAASPATATANSFLTRLWLSIRLRLKSS